MDLQEQLTALLPACWSQKCEWLSPCMVSHVIFFEVLAAGPGAAKQQADIMNMAIQKHHMTVHGKPIKSGVETSRQRRAAVEEYYHQRDTVLALNKNGPINTCERGLGIRDRTSLVRIGWWSRATESWTRDRSAASVVNFNLPMDISGDPEALDPSEQPEVAKQGAAAKQPEHVEQLQAMDQPTETADEGEKHEGDEGMYDAEVPAENEEGLKRL